MDLGNFGSMVMGGQICGPLCLSELCRTEAVEGGEDPRTGWFGGCLGIRDDLLSLDLRLSPLLGLLR